MTAFLKKYGEIGHRSEEIVAQYLAQNLPDIYQVHYALKLGREMTDFDCVVVAPHAIYVLEVKAYGESIKYDPDKVEWILSSGERKPVAVSQAARNRSILNTLLQEYYLGFKGLPVQEVVCLYAENKPNLQIPEDQRGLTFWYRDLPTYLQNPRRLPRSWSRFDLSAYMDIVQQGFAVGFSRPRYMRDYKIQSCIWITNQYRGYTATSRRFPNQHLLKVYDLPTNTDNSTVQKFIDDLDRERNALKLLVDRGDRASGGKDHVVVFDEAFYYNKGNQYVIVMNAVEGELLSTLMQHHDKLPRKKRYGIAAQMCRGLEFVHSAGIIHRGLHPENVVLSKDGMVKLINFNFAKFVNPPVLTGFETLPSDNFLLMRWNQDAAKIRRYLAPEMQPKGREDTQPDKSFYSRATRETDLYGLGVILWELFAGETCPGSQAESLDKKAGYPTEVASLVRQMVSSDREERKLINLLEVATLFEDLENDEQPDQRSLPELLPGQKFKDFEIESRLATTLMSHTYKAKDKFGDGRVVVKFLRSNNPQESLNEMNRTWSILRKMNWMYTARLVDGGYVYVRHGKIQDSPNGAQMFYFQVFEYLEGKTLRELVQEGLIRADAQALRHVILGLLEAVSVVHRAGWIHQDVKPDNLILTDQGQVKVIDFGLSQRVNSGGDAIAQSPVYAPPEVRRPPEGPGQPWTQAGDVYSTAYVILALVCGEMASKGPVLNAEQVLAVGGQEFLDLLQKDTSQDPAERLPSAMAMLEKYRPVLENPQPIAPEPIELPTTPVEKLMDKAKVEHIINELSSKADEQPDATEYNRFIEAADTLAAWLEQGQPGNFPLDLTQFGVGAETVLPATLPEIKNEESVPVATVPTPESISAPITVATTPPQDYSEELVEPVNFDSVLSSTIQPELDTHVPAKTSQENDVVENITTGTSTLLESLPDIMPGPSESKSSTVPSSISQPELDTSAPAATGLEGTPVENLTSETQTLDQPSPEIAPGLSEARPSTMPALPRSGISEAERGSQVARLLETGNLEMQKIENADPNGDFLTVRNVINQVRQLDSSNQDASSLELSLELYERRDAIRRLKKNLIENNDPGPLDAFINQADKLIHEGKSDIELSELVEKARKRRDEIRDFMGRETTSNAFKALDKVNSILVQLEQGKNTTRFGDHFRLDDALEGLEGANAILAGLEASRLQGLTTFYDERISADRPVSEFMKEMREKQAILAQAAIEHKEARALSFMPDEGVRSPKSAIPLIQDALAVKGQSSANILRLKALLDNWQIEEKKWEEVERLLGEIDDTKDVIKKLGLARKAQRIYPYHERVHNIQTLMKSACSILQERLHQAIEKGEIELQKAPEEAARLRRENSSQLLQSFTAARQAVNEVLLEIADLKDEERTDELKAQVKLAREFLERVKNAETRRQAIAAKYNEVQFYISASDKQAIENADKALPADYFDDPEIRYLREQIQKFAGVEDLLQNARSYHKAQLWEDCLKVCNEIARRPLADRQNFQVELDGIRAEANLSIQARDIRQALEGAYYYKAAESIRKFYAEPGHEDLRGKLAQSLNLEVVRQNLADREGEDRQFNIRQEWERIEKDLKNLEKNWDKVRQIEPKPDLPDNLIELAAQLHDRLNDLRVKESSYKGALRDSFLRAQVLLHDLLIHELQRLHIWYQKTSQSERDAFDLIRVYRLADTLVSKKLAYTQDADLRRWALLSYFDRQDRESDDLEQKVKNWQTAFEQFRSEQVFRKRLYAAQIDYLVSTLDACLRAQDYQRVERLLKREEILIEGFNFDYHSEPRLEVRKQFADFLKQNVGMDAREDYLGLSENFKGWRKTLDGLDAGLVGDLKIMAEDQHKKAIEASINKLLEKGSELINATGGKRDIAGAVGAYAIALRLNPEHLVVRQNIQTHASEIELQSDLAILKAQSARGNVGLDNLADRIEEYRTLEKRMRSLADACAQLGKQDKANKLLHALDGGMDNLVRVLREMEGCQDLLNQMEPSGSMWKNQCLGEGRWEEANQILRTLSQSIIGGGHKAVQELSERIQLNSALRNSLGLLKDEIRVSNRKEEFEIGIKLCNDLDRMLSDLMTLHNIPPQFPPVDPYRLILPNWRELELFTRKFIPYFGTSPTPPLPANEADFEHMTLRQSLVIRQKNLEAWKKIDVVINEKYHELVESPGIETKKRPCRNPAQPTRAQLDQVIAYISKSQTILEKCQKLLEIASPPLSAKADLLKQSGLQQVQSIEKELQLAESDQVNLQDDEQKIQRRIDLAVDLLNRNVDSEAQDHILAANAFYQDSKDNPNLEFIQHFANVLDKAQ